MSAVVTDLEQLLQCFWSSLKTVDDWFLSRMYNFKHQVCEMWEANDVDENTKRIFCKCLHLMCPYKAALENIEIACF